MDMYYQVVDCNVLKHRDNGNSSKINESIPTQDARR